MPWKSALPALIENADPSRNVPEKVSEDQIREEIPYNWKEDQVLWSYVNKYRIGGSGVGFITPPYMAFWERIWGATPIEDLPKYKDLYTFIPYITKSVDVTINMAVSNGFELEGGDDEAREWLQDWIDQHNLLQTIRIAATDMLVYGNAYLEVCRDEASGDIVWLKPLDPVHMRVRRDQFGNVFGYIQMLTFPPVVFTSGEVIQFRYGAKSSWYEWNYGTSLLRPLLKVQALIDQFQDDMAQIVHLYTKPMLVIKAGTVERPYSEPQRQALQDVFTKRVQAPTS